MLALNQTFQSVFLHMTKKQF